MSDSPWNNVGQRYQRGMHVNGQVTATTRYGAYVEVEPGVEGLIPIGPDGSASSTFSVGDEVEVVVLEVDEHQRLIRFGVMQ